MHVGGTGVLGFAWPKISQPCSAVLLERLRSSGWEGVSGPCIVGRELPCKLRCDGINSKFSQKIIVFGPFEWLQGRRSEVDRR